MLHTDVLFMSVNLVISYYLECLAIAHIYVRSGMVSQPLPPYTRSPIPLFLEMVRKS